MRAHAIERRARLAAALATLVASLAVAELGAAADSGGLPAPGGDTPPDADKPSGEDKPAADDPSGADKPAGGDKPGADGNKPPGGPGPLGKVRLVATDVSPKSIFIFGDQPASFEFEVAGFGGAVDLTVEIVSQRTREVVRRFPADDVKAHVPTQVKWAGRTTKGRVPAGRYRFQVHGKQKVDSDAAEGARTVGYFKHKFPIRGPHTYGDGIGAGRGHRGQDLFAACGTPLEAALAGKVQWKAYQASGAGHYIVIDGRRTGKDFVYMHLAEPSPVTQGERVRTGERIGSVGETGNATGCHLHFELWSAPGWYEGGRFLNPTPALKQWDRYS